METDLDIDMDQALQIVQLNEDKVGELTTGLEVQRHGKTGTDQACTCPVIGVKDLNPKQRRHTSRIVSKKEKVCNLVLCKLGLVGNYERWMIPAQAT